MSMFRLIKYSSIIYFLGKHRGKLFRSIAVLLFALVSSLIYEDVRVYLASQHPETLIYALTLKVLIVYGSLAFVLWQFRPNNAVSSAEIGKPSAPKAGTLSKAASKTMGTLRRDEPPAEDQSNVDSFSRLNELADLDRHDRLATRYERVLAKGASVEEKHPKRRHD